MSCPAVFGWSIVELTKLGFAATGVIMQPWAVAQPALPSLLSDQFQRKIRAASVPREGA